MDTKKVEPVNANSQALSEVDENRDTRGLSADALHGANIGANNDRSRKDILVLVVDDVIDNVALLSLDLQHEGYRVITASNGEEAVKVASLMRPNIILMDISMPLLDGLAATAKIREDENLRTVPVIATTSYSTAGFRRAAYDVGFNGYLTKPLDFEQLHDLIARLLPGTKAMDNRR